jgi:hypothetical protein
MQIGVLSDDFCCTPTSGGLLTAFLDAENTGIGWRWRRPRWQYIPPDVMDHGQVVDKKPINRGINGAGDIGLTMLSSQGTLIILAGLYRAPNQYCWWRMRPRWFFLAPGRSAVEVIK